MESRYMNNCLSSAFNGLVSRPPFYRDIAGQFYDSPLYTNQFSMDDDGHMLHPTVARVLERYHHIIVLPSIFQYSLLSTTITAMAAFSKCIQQMNEHRTISNGVVLNGYATAGRNNDNYFAVPGPYTIIQFVYNHIDSETRERVDCIVIPGEFAGREGSVYNMADVTETLDYLKARFRVAHLMFQDWLLRNIYLDA